MESNIIILRKWIFLNASYGLHPSLSLYYPRFNTAYISGIFLCSSEYHQVSNSRLISSPMTRFCYYVNETRVIMKGTDVDTQWQVLKTRWLLSNIVPVILPDDRTLLYEYYQNSRYLFPRETHLDKRRVEYRATWINVSTAVAHANRSKTRALQTRNGGHLFTHITHVYRKRNGNEQTKRNT